MLNRILQEDWEDRSLIDIYDIIQNVDRGENGSISIRVWIPTRKGQGDWKTVTSVWRPQGTGEVVAFYVDSVFIHKIPATRRVRQDHKFQILRKPNNKWRSYG